MEGQTLIDLHNHTILSDGSYELLELCKIKKDIVDTICITDHFPSYKNAYPIGKNEADKYTLRKMKYPEKYKGLPNVIVGMEFMFNNIVEVLIFGKKCINEVIKFIPKNYKALKSIVKDNECAVVICHPIRNDELYNDTLLSIADGIEITIRGDFLKGIEKDLYKVKNKYNLHFFSNSDFHDHISSDVNTYNIIERKITNEKELISAVKDKNLQIINMINDKPYPAI